MKMKNYHRSMLMLIDIVFLFIHRIRLEETRLTEPKATNTTTTINQSNSTTIDESSSSTWPTSTYAYIYGGILASLFIVALFRSFTFFNFCATASRNLHDSMFRGLIATKMRFFDTNPSGRIINRFSKDMGSTDEALPKSCFDSTQINLCCIGAICVTIFSNVKFSIVILFMFMLFLWARKIYLRCSTNIKRFEGTSMWLIAHL